MIGTRYVLVGDCSDGDVVLHNGQEWRVDGVADGLRVLYGITRRGVARLPATALVETRRVTKDAS